MKWIVGIKRRVLKKWLHGQVHHDGTAHSFERWNAVLDEVAALKPGDPIFNCYIHRWTTVVDVTFERGHWFGLDGNFIDAFFIKDSEGYSLGAPPSELSAFCQRSAPAM